MKKQTKMQIAAAGIAINTLLGVANGMAQAGGHMDGMTTIENIKTIIDIGITPCLLLIFVWYFLSKSRDDDNKVKNAYEDAQRKIEETNNIIREREDTLIANAAKREEMLRSEAEKREAMLRQESEKRESVLMLNMDRMLDGMNSITSALNKMEASFGKMEARLENIEQKIEGNM